MDNFTDGSKDPNYGRASVYIRSNQMYDLESLIIMDADHLPFGVRQAVLRNLLEAQIVQCSVWPAFFTQGSDWPKNGEIDIIENVNMATANRYALHTYSGCSVPSSESSSMQTGKIVSSNCNGTDNSGCVISDPSNKSFGQNFAGGVFATLFDANGVKSWFFERDQVPDDVKGGSPTPGSWSTPSAFFPASSCDPTKFLGPQTLTLVRVPSSCLHYLSVT